jgi:hypothetical protein
MLLLRKNTSIMDYNAQYWKSRATLRNAENKEIKKRLQEVIEGREKWKAKYMLKSEEALNFKKEIGNIKKKIEKIIVK